MEVNFKNTYSKKVEDMFSDAPTHKCNGYSSTRVLNNRKGGKNVAII